MKKYLAITLLCLASVSFAASNSVKLGQKDHNSDPDPCNKPEILGCGPCHKQCLEQNNIEGYKDVNVSQKKPSGGSKSSTATKQ